MAVSPMNDSHLLLAMLRREALVYAGQALGAGSAPAAGAAGLVSRSTFHFVLAEGFVQSFLAEVVSALQRPLVSRAPLV